jgi:transcriptional regulator with XRE-family HTH domain
MQVTAAGDKVRELREAQGWSQEELGRRAGVNKETINRFELGGGNRTSTVRKIAAVLGLSVGELLSSDDAGERAAPGAITLTADERELVELWRSSRVPADYKTGTIAVLRDFAARGRKRRTA